MKPEAQRIAIAEARGMRGPFTIEKEWFSDGDSDGLEPVMRDCNGRRVPDYPADLNAMHEAEKILTHQQKQAYIRVLAIVCDGEQEEYGSGEFDQPWPSPANQCEYDWFERPDDCAIKVVTATAAQRAEAFLRILGKWEDDK